MQHVRQQNCKHVANGVVDVDADVDVDVHVALAFLKCAANLAFDAFHLLRRSCCTYLSIRCTRLVKRAYCQPENVQMYVA